MEEKNIFNRKEIYLISHDKNGKLFLDKNKTKRRPMYRYDNLHLVDGMSFTSYHGVDIPVLSPLLGSLECEFIPFSERKKYSGKNQGVHFFQYDDTFRFAVWNRLEKTTYDLKNFEILTTPDFTMYVDRPSFFALQSVFMTRFVGAYWQKCGYRVLPTASWSDVDSFEFAFLGLPEHSPIAVGGVGVKGNPGAQELWHLGLLELEKRVQPSQILIYGDSRLELPTLNTPVKFIIDNITKHFRNDRNIQERNREQIVA
ncbi:MAG: DUF4417 domain-containing protein [Paludibacteraceae bacterium]|nr:DUF4417 domain-containing protein [Paludibacteraceae bacterium]